MNGQRVESGACPRPIEVALPIREISADGVRDKNIHHAHVSHLHIWWARRPLAATRAVVFASLVPDADDPQCPADFQAAVRRHLMTHVRRRSNTTAAVGSIAELTTRIDHTKGPRTRCETVS